MPGLASKEKRLMSVCVSGPLLRGLALGPFSQPADFFSTSVQRQLDQVTRPLTSELGRQVAFAQSDRHHLFITLAANGAAGRQIRVHLIDGDGLAERFTGAVDGNVVSLASAGGALLVGMLTETEMTGSLVFPDGRAHRFSAEFSSVA
jgi:hypothetical protein